MKQNIRIIYLLLLISMSILSCTSKEKVDLILYNARIVTIDSLMQEASSMVVSEGKIIAIGDSTILAGYQADRTIDLKGKFVYPGLIDAHSHFYGLGLYALTVDLTGTKSWQEVLDRCKQFADQHHPAILTGRGWDQNDWKDKSFPDNQTLSQLFPEIPVLLKRVDGHAAIANKKALELSGITPDTKMNGGEIISENHKLTGLLIDNAVDLVQDKLPKPDHTQIKKALLKAQEMCFAYGLTSVCDAGLETETIRLIDSMQQKGELSIRIYAMVSLTEQNLNEWLKRGPYKTDRLHVSSFKMYADGALGSRGACMLHPYSDRQGHSGFLLTPATDMEKYVQQIAASPFQLNTHCIGDSANRLILQLYGKYLQTSNDRRWRIEHAQVVNPADWHYFNDFSVLPSMQPVHATSDMYWAEERIGKERIKGAYALHSLLQQNGWFPLGTDFPVESPNPFHTLYAAVYRKDNTGFPEGGFMKGEALTSSEALKGMTIWAAKAAFEEQEKGSLEPGKFADFIVTSQDLMNGNPEQIRDAQADQVFVNGVQVFERAAKQSD